MSSIDQQLSDTQARVVLAVDIGGTKVDAALVDIEGRVVSASRSRRPTGAASTRDEIGAAIASAVQAALSHRSGAKVIGVGIGSAGPIDLERGAVSPINLPALEGFPVQELLQREVPDVPVRLALDGTCIALAEHRFGAARGSRNSLSMVVSTGVGGGFVINGHPVSGRSGNAGHIGQLRIERWDAGASPEAGTLEAVASGPCTVAWAREQGWTGATGEELALAYSDGDEIARRAVVRSAHAVGEAIANASTLLDLDVVVLAGGFVNVAADYVDLVADRARDATFLSYANRVSIVRTGLGGDGPIMGAAALVIDG